MKTPTAEQLRAALPTDDQVDDIVSRISSGKIRRCIPVQVDDDDVLIANVLEDWKRLRAQLEEARREARAVMVDAGETLPESIRRIAEYIRRREQERDDARADVARLAKYEPRLLHAEIKGDGSATARIKAPAVADFAESMAAILLENKAHNYIEMVCTHPTGDIAVTIQRVTGKTPAAKAAAHEAVLRLAVRGCLDPGGDEPFREFIVKLAEWREANPEPERTR